MINSIRLMVFMILLYFFFVISGIFEEKIFKESINHLGRKYTFKYPFVTIFFNSLFSFIISSSFLFILSPKNLKNISPISNKDKAILGVYSLICKLTNEGSLSYLDFITRIIGKSCKSASSIYYLKIVIGIYFLYKIPFLGSLLKKMINIKQETEVHHSGNGDIIKVIITTVSIILFSIDETSGQKTTGSNEYLYLGYILLIISLLFDGIIAIKEKTINHDVHNKSELAEFKKLLSWEYMNCFSLWSLIFSIFGLIYSFLLTNFSLEYKIFLFEPNFFLNIILGTLFSSLGQVFIFQILEKYGPLTLSIITGVRKILSIIVSIIYFNKSIGYIKIFSLFLGGSVIVWEILEKSTKSHHEKCEKTKPHSN